METAAGEGINRKRSRGSAGRDEGVVVVVVVVVGGDRRMRSMQKGCHIKQPPTENIFGRLLCQNSRVEVASFNDYPA